jgi:hypothetical protein
MSPRFFRGEKIAVSESGPVQADDYVVLDMRTGTQLVALLVSMSDESLELRTLESPRRVSTISRSDVTRMRHVVTMNDIAGVPGPSSFLRN